MAEPTQPQRPATPRDGLFQEPVREARSLPVVPIAIAAVVVLLVTAVLVIAGHRHGAASGSPDVLRPPASAAATLPLSGVAMSESTSFSGGKSTFIDGRITNKGSATVTGITVQVLFAPDGGGAPQLETVPLNLIRTRQPYVDTEPVSAAPLVPGAAAEFRLIFEGIRPEWNQQLPDIRIVDVQTR